MKSFDWVLLISRWIHLTSAIVAVGGAAFMRIALLPAAQKTLTTEVHDRLREALVSRWMKVIHICIALLLITGSVNFVILAMPPKIDPLPYHPLFGVKALAAFTVFYIAIGLVSRGPTFARVRAARAKSLNILLVLAVMIVLISGVLAQVRTWPKRGQETPSRAQSSQ